LLRAYSWRWAILAAVGGIGVAGLVTAKTRPFSRVGWLCLCLPSAFLPLVGWGLFVALVYLLMAAWAVCLPVIFWIRAKQLRRADFCAMLFTLYSTYSIHGFFDRYMDTFWP